MKLNPFRMKFYKTKKKPSKYLISTSHAHIFSLTSPLSSRVSNSTDRWTIPIFQRHSTDALPVSIFMAARTFSSALCVARARHAKSRMFLRRSEREVWGQGGTVASAALWKWGWGSVTKALVQTTNSTILFSVDSMKFLGHSVEND
jgi:hypothetical protein